MQIRSFARAAAMLLLVSAAGCTAQDRAVGSLAGPAVEPRSLPPGSASFTFDQGDELYAPDPSIEAQLGVSIALDGDTMLVGAPGALNLGAGAAYVMVRVNGQWTLQQELFSPDGDAYDELGVMVALQGDTAVVGARSAEYGGLGQAGAVYVYTRTNGVWSAGVRLVPGDPAAGDWFGDGLALSGDTLFVGAVGKNGSGQGVGTGALYVFQRTNGAWTEAQEILPPAPGTVERFGHSAVIQGDEALVGTNSDDIGRVYTMKRTNGLWAIDGQFSASDGALTDRFGFRVDIDGDRAIASALRADVNGIVDAGAVYVLDRSNGVWSESAKLVASNPSLIGDQMGWSAALQGDLVLAGATIAASPKDDSTGAVYVFSRSNGVWSEEEILVANDTKASDGVGSAIAIQGDTLAMGAAQRSGSVQYQGAVYTFKVGGFPAVSDGGSCAADAECLNGHCADGVCCDTACDAECQACSVAAGAPSDGVCAPISGAACDDGDACTDGDSCVSGACQGEIIGCPAPAECHEAGACDPATGTCDSPASPDGSACAKGTCQSGECAPSGTGGAGGATITGSGASAGSGGDGASAGSGGGSSSGGGQSGGCQSGGCQSGDAAPSSGAAGAALLALSSWLARRRRAGARR